MKVRTWFYRITPSVKHLPFVRSSFMVKNIAEIYLFLTFHASIFFGTKKKVRNKKNNNNKKLNMLIYLFGVTWCNDIQGAARAQALCQQLGRVETKPKPNAVVRDNSTIVDKNLRVLMRLLVHCTPAMIVDRVSNPYPLP